jgi:hypothetical protein
MAGSANVPYNPNNSVAPTSGAGNDYVNVSADPNAFGVNVGNSISKMGAAASDLSEKNMALKTSFATMATEAKVNDDYANKYAPAAAELREKYDSLRGQDKIHGYDAYIQGLQDLNKSFTESAPSPLYQHAIGGLINRHVASEIDGAKRELVASQKQFSDEAYASRLVAGATQAANNPAIMGDIIKQGDSLITVKHIDSGVDPNSEEGRAKIEQDQAAYRTTVGTAALNRFIQSGDARGAYGLRQTFSPYLPIDTQNHVDSVLMAQSNQQTSQATVSAFMGGSSAPEPVAMPPAQTRALVANTASTSGVDPNQALTVCHIESACGQNVGSRGTLGQDKESAGKPLDVQAQALCDNWKKATDASTSTLGRQPEPWESYVSYQQGASGGGALLSAARSDKAIDVLSSVYGNSKDALKALTSNGGNATMSVGDFLNGIKTMWSNHEKAANCEFPDDKSPGDAIMTPHTTSGTMVQPAPTPRQALMNLQEKMPQLQAQIDAIPNVETRRGVQLQFNQEVAKVKGAASMYSEQLVGKAAQLMADPKFSMDQVSPELYSSLSTEHPQTLIAMQNRAKENAENVSGRDRDAKSYGSAYPELYSRAHPVGGSDTPPLTADDVMRAYNSGQITSAGSDKLLNDMAKGVKAPPEEQEYRKVFMDYAKNRISPAADKDIDPEGNARYLKFIMQADAQVAKAKADGKTAAQIYDPENGELAKSIKLYEQDYNNSMPGPKETGSNSLFRTLFSSPSEGAPPRVDDRVVGQSYTSPKLGKLIWTESGWVKPEDYKAK